MKAGILALCLLLLCPWVTASARTVSDSAAPLSAVTPAQNATYTYRLVLDYRSDPIVQQGARLFSDKVSELSGGTMVIHVQTSPDPATEFATEGAQLAFVSGDNKDFCPEFALLSAPLRYRDQKHMTVTLNSQRILEFMDATPTAFRNAKFMAAYYTGSSYLVSGEPLSVPNLSRSSEEELDPVAALRTGSSLSEAFTDFGLLVVETTPSTRLQWLEEGECSVAEFTLQELAELEWGGGREWFLSITGHDITPLWLVIDNDLFYWLPEREQAVLLEAQAYLFWAIDQEFLEQEKRLFAESLGDLVILDADSVSFRDDLAESLRSEESGWDTRSAHLLELLRSIA